MRVCASSALLIVSLSLAVDAASALPRFDTAHARAYFDEARKVSLADGGRLWGETLYGPIFFVDLDTGKVIANEPVAGGDFQKEDGVYVGTLPKDITPSDTPVEWAGKRWSMLLWQLMPEDRLTREKMLGHEMFHRIQPGLHLAPPDTPNLQLDTPKGRLWLQLEWRALAAALVDRGPSQVQAIRDALAFRRHRQEIFSGSSESERSLEIAEGVPEYTGLVAAAPDQNAARWYAIARLAEPDQSISLVRSFAYVSGPAYGLLLDERLPGWRRLLNDKSDLGRLLGSTVKGPAVSAVARADLYGASAIRTAEADRAAAAQAVKDRYRALLVDGPTLTIPAAGKFNFTFNPSTVVSIQAGAVYPTFKVSDAWGKLEVDDGALLPTDFSKVTVAAPKNLAGSHIVGPGWKLDLAPGWVIAPAPKSGSFLVRKAAG